MVELTKHDSTPDLFIGRAEERQVSELLRSLVPEPRAVRWMPVNTLYLQRNGNRAPSLLACHNAQAQAGEAPIYRWLAGLLGYQLVPMLKPIAGADPGLTMLDATAKLGRVADDLKAALDPAGPGGTRCTPAELSQLTADAMAAAADLHQVVGAMRARM